jgi:hypothetical protein
MNWCFVINSVLKYYLDFIVLGINYEISREVKKFKKKASLKLNFMLELLNNMLY